jgi:hypothetical protein
MLEPIELLLLVEAVREEEVIVLAMVVEVVNEEVMVGVIVE